MSELIGNLHVQRAIEKTLPSPALFYGVKGIGKKTFARTYFSRLLGSKLENNPDFRLFSPEGKGHVHTVARMHELIRDIDLPPHSAPVKCYLIEEAERLSDASGNALLKTLEEHPPHARIILLSENIDALLPTILSRCLKVPFHPASLNDIATLLTQRGCAEEEAQRIATLSDGSFGKALALHEQGIGEGERLMRELLSNPGNRALLDQIDQFVGDDKTNGIGLLTLLSRIKKGDEAFVEPLAHAEEAYRHHMKLSNVLEVLLT